MENVLLHSCCAPCSSAILEWMTAHDIQPVIYYYNPNIFPAEEYRIRKNEITRYAQRLGIRIIDDDVNDGFDKLTTGNDNDNDNDNDNGLRQTWEQQHEQWRCQIAGLEHEPERGNRCLECFRMRLLHAARKAKELGIRRFTTTLASSRWKSLEQINTAGLWAAEQVGEVEFWDQNWRKGGLQQRRNELLKENGFYNQLYCGCEYSMERLKPKYTKWVACWGNATSITDRRECVYAKDITLRYPIFMPFAGNKLRLRLSNLTGTEEVVISKLVVGSQLLTDIHIPAGEEVTTPEIEQCVEAGNTLVVSLYLADCTQMNAGTLITGPLSRGEYAYGDYAKAETFPIERSRKTNWFYFLNTIDILTEECNRALICYGDSITAQSWPDYLAQRCWDEGYRHVAIIRRAVSGTRILRQYDCITYQAYGLKGAIRFPIEMNVAGADTVIIQHGINDIIHPVGVEANPFRPWSDMPTLQELEQGIETLYLQHARSLGYKVYVGTLLPIYGWRTYNEERDAMRRALNEYLLTSPLYDGAIDFDAAVRDTNNTNSFAPGYDSGDHLHPSEAAYKAMAEAVPTELLKG